MNPTASFALRLSLTAALAAGLSAPASAQRGESRSFSAGHFMLSLDGQPSVVGSFGSGGGQRHNVDIESWSWGRALLDGGASNAGRKGWDGTVKGGSVADDVAAARKGWDGSVKGARTDDGSGTAKFGAISGVRRNEGMSDPAAKTKPVKSVQYDLKSSSVARLAPSPATPPVSGSITVDGNFAGCKVGTQYSSAALRLADVLYVMTDVQVTHCPASTATLGGLRTDDSLSLDYKKVVVRGWDPEKKEE